MAKLRHISLQNAYPFFNKTSLFNVSWGLRKRKQDKDQLSQKFESIFDYLKKYFLQTGIKGLVYYDVFPVETDGDTLIFKDSTVHWKFPRMNGRCITDSAKSTGRIALQIVSLGKGITNLLDTLEKEELLSMMYYFHGFAVWLTEALAEYHHGLIHDEWGTSHVKERYSFGYPLCPDLTMQRDLFNLLKIGSSDEVSLSSEYMMIPEQTTSAIIFN